ncbi:MAG: TrbC/VirB2 family protein [Blastocatellia bacterium]
MNFKALPHFDRLHNVTISSLVKSLHSRFHSLVVASTRLETQRLLVLCFLVAFILLSDRSVFAQAGATDGGQITTTLQNLIQTIYNSWRIPISIIGLIVAAILFLFSHTPQAKSWAARIVVGVMLFALIPAIINLVSGWTGTTGSGNLPGH